MPPAMLSEVSTAPRPDHLNTDTQVFGWITG